MIGVTSILNIKRLCDKGESVAGVARAEGVSEPTVRKYRDMDDVSPTLPARRARATKLDPFKPIIDGWLDEDMRRRPKQRHTATRIFERLRDEYGYGGGHASVQACVRKRKADRKAASDMYLRLEWAPAEAQVDFGQCEFRVLGVVTDVHYLVAAFPHSNVSLAQCFPGENAECVCEGLKAVFEYVGGVPRRLVFDNAAGIGRKVSDAFRTTETFERFAAHYGFEFTFCNPESGHEKGAVENAVGAIRRQLFVPMPSIEDVRAYNARLLTKCLARASKRHYAKGRPEIELFDEDRAALRDLPAKAFRVFRPASFKADKYGRVLVGGRHGYELGPEHAGERVVAELGAFEIGFYTDEGAEVARYGRAYGDAPTESADPLSQLALLCNKPGGWRNSRVRSALPEAVRDHVDSLGRADMKEVLRTMRDSSSEAGWGATVEAMDSLLRKGASLDRADVTMSALLAANGQGAVSYDNDDANLSAYDVAFSRGA